MIIETKMHGMEEMIELLKQLPDETKIKALRPATREMGMLLRGIAIELSPYLKSPAPGRVAGALRRGIRLVRKNTGVEWKQVYGLHVKTRRKLTNRMGFSEGNKRGKQGSVEDPFYWFFLEFGTVHMKAQPFMRPALEGKQQEYISTFKRNFNDKLLSLVRSLHAKQARFNKRWGI